MSSDKILIQSISADTKILDWPWSVCTNADTRLQLERVLNMNQIVYMLLGRHLRKDQHNCKPIFKFSLKRELALFYTDKKEMLKSCEFQ